jgi:ABC-type phosphate transport system ATPase subunit
MRREIDYWKTRGKSGYMHVEEKKEVMAILENERRERLAEKKEMMATLENEKRDRLLGDERRERLAEKKEMMARGARQRLSTARRSTGTCAM